MWLGYNVDVHTKHGGVPTPTAKIGFYLGTWAGAGNVRIDITSAVRWLATRCLILGWVLQVNLSDEDIAEVGNASRERPSSWISAPYSGILKVFPGRIPRTS